LTSADLLVLDASVGLKWVLPEENADVARTLLTQTRRGEVQLVAPDAYLPEVTNALWARSHLRDDLTVNEARDALDRLLLTLPSLVPSSGLAAQALELSLAFGHAVYDCLYVALAIRNGCSVITADRAMIRAFGRATGRVIDIATFSA
jgi:predicted nucleic acid-binding protein